MVFCIFQNCGESVNSVEGGVVGTAGFDEIVATTYTGLKQRYNSSSLSCIASPVLYTVGF